MKNTKLEICNKCWGTGHVHGGDENSTWSKSCEDCRGLGFVRVPKTNADRIRAMTDEELAAHLVDIGFDCHLCSEHRRLDNEPLLRNEKCDEKCEKHCLDWLHQPAEGDA